MRNRPAVQIVLTSEGQPHALQDS
ncbi:Protein of unknown function [Leuconostoc citreum]|nr:Protein of unknown function [Leuconostoc citreum LBAE C10]CCF27180.1 Protein of unknown function [Leuconostoc citreum LBAE C11]CDX64744.1 Protein of unknown function [Leuconostoc citreum]